MLVCIFTDAQIIAGVYLMYNFALILSAVLYSVTIDMSQDAAVAIICSVVAMHFLLGATSILRDGVGYALSQRFGVSIHPFFKIHMSFRHTVTLMGDFLLIVALILSSLVLLVDDVGINQNVLYGISITSAFVGNWICNLLHFFPQEDDAQQIV